MLYNTCIIIYMCVCESLSLCLGYVTENKIHTLLVSWYGIIPTYSRQAAVILSAIVVQVFKFGEDSLLIY